MGWGLRTGFASSLSGPIEAATFRRIAIRAHLQWGRLRGLYNGLGYVLVMCLLCDLWWTAEGRLPELVAGHWGAFVRGFLSDGRQGALTMLAAPVLIPPGVNLAPRSPLARFIWLSALTFLLWWWCLALVDGVHFGWDWPSLGFALNGFLTPGAAVGVCAYHSRSREAADALLCAQIHRASLDGELMQAQLLLRAQIEPHFLFNTLSVVRALARNDRASTVAMLDHRTRARGGPGSSERNSWRHAMPGPIRLGAFSCCPDYSSLTPPISSHYTA